MTAMPGYWMYESSGKLRPVIVAYLDGKKLSPEQCSIMRAYLRQWIAGPWEGPDVDLLRIMIDTLDTREAIAAWLDRALDSNIDPL